MYKSPYDPEHVKELIEHSRDMLSIVIEFEQNIFGDNGIFDIDGQVKYSVRTIAHFEESLFKCIEDDFENDRKNIKAREKS